MLINRIKAPELEVKDNLFIFIVLNIVLILKMAAISLSILFKVVSKVHYLTLYHNIYVKYKLVDLFIFYICFTEKLVLN